MSPCCLEINARTQVVPQEADLPLLLALRILMHRSKISFDSSIGRCCAPNVPPDGDALHSFQDSAIHPAPGEAHA